VSPARRLLPASHKREAFLQGMVELFANTSKTIHDIVRRNIWMLQRNFRGTMLRRSNSGGTSRMEIGFPPGFVENGN
jgi:hypothetical protein